MGKFPKKNISILLNQLLVNDNLVYNFHFRIESIISESEISTNSNYTGIDFGFDFIQFLGTDFVL